jgi:hypothetical protein
MTRIERDFPDASELEATTRIAYAALEVAGDEPAERAAMAMIRACSVMVAAFVGPERRAAFLEEAADFFRMEAEDAGEAAAPRH